MKSIAELSKGLGPVRRKELTEAAATSDAAKTALDKLQNELAQHKADVAALEPQAQIGPGANVAVLANAQLRSGATTALIDHLERVAIPAAAKLVTITAQTVSELVSAHGRRRAYIESQRKIIGRAQAEVDEAQAWIDA